jgi:CheY-like chemotaxis protein
VPTSARNILYVEDNAADVLLVREALAEAQAEADLHVCENGVQAFWFLKGMAPNALKPDCILLDWNLPLISGAKILAEIRGDQTWAQYRVIVFTSSRHPKDREVAERLGARFET